MRLALSQLLLVVDRSRLDFLSNCWQEFYDHGRKQLHLLSLELPVVESEKGLTKAMAEETTQNTAGDETANPSGQAPTGKTAGENAPPSTVEEQAPSVVSENLHSTSEPVAAEIPTANAPDPAENLVDNPESAQEKGTKVVSGQDKSADSEEDDHAGSKKAASPPKKEKPAAKADGDKPAAAKAAKKEKAPAVEDKPFAEFIQQYYLPALQKALAQQGVKNLELTFAKQKVAIAGFNDECPQVIGRWENGVSCQFNVYFPEENIQGKRAFSCNEGSKPSTLEPFLIDERKITLDLMVFAVLQRLNGQKWLALN